jgi:hypothetical protein
MNNGRFAAILGVLITVGVAAWPSSTQKSVVRGVTVAVTPGNLAQDSGIWDFALSIDGGRQRLDDELMEDAVLVGDGQRMKPLAWEGDRAGGTHRAGVLKFIALKPRPKEIQLQLTRPGEATPRVFTFVFGDWSA